MDPIDDDELQLLAAIRAEPDADAPRLVYADWLSQRGDPRGERIVIQCELVREELSDERHDELRRRDEAIAPIAVPDMALDVELPCDSFAIGDPPPWSRGFVPAHTVSCNADDFAARKHDLYRWAPCGRELRLWDFDDTGGLARVLADPDVVRWGALQRIPLALSRSVARHAHLDALRAIAFDADEEEEPDVLAPVFAAQRLPNLEAIEIRGMMIDGNLAYLGSIPDEQWRSAAFASTLRHYDGEMLDSLDVFPRLEQYASGFYGGGHLTTIAKFTGKLRRLALGPESASYDPLQPVLQMDRLVELLRADCMATAETIAFDAERSAPHTVSAWRELDRTSVRALSLTSGIVSSDLLEALIAGPRLSELRALRLHGRNPLSNDGLVALATSRAWPHLQELDLGTQWRPTAVIARLIERLPALRRLRCGAADLADVLALDELDQLEVLQLDAEANTSAWPQRPLPRLRLVQVQFPSQSGKAYREVVDHWARPRRMQVLAIDRHAASRGDAAVTAVRFGSNFEAWQRSFLL